MIRISLLSFLFLFLLLNAIDTLDWEDMDQEDEDEDEGNEDGKEAGVMEVEVAVEEDLQREQISKPPRDVRKRVDATRILTTEDFKLIGTTYAIKFAAGFIPIHSLIFSLYTRCPLVSSFLSFI